MTRTRRATRDGRHVLDQVGDVVGEEIDGCDEEVTAAHRRVEDLQVEYRLGRIELEQVGASFGFGPAFAGLSCRDFSSNSSRRSSTSGLRVWSMIRSTSSWGV